MRFARCEEYARLTAGLPALLAVVDLDAFDRNAGALVARAAGTPIRVASKSVRCRTLIARALARPGFAGVLAYSLQEALWLAAPSGTRTALPTPVAPAIRSRGLSMAVSTTSSWRIRPWIGSR